MMGEQNATKRKANSILIQGSILAAASLLVRVIGLIYRIPLTRILGDEAMGYYSTAFQFYNLALLLSSYSLPLAVSKLVSAREVKKQYRNSRKVFVFALGFGAVVGTVATLVVYFGADAYGRLNKTELVAIPLRVLAPTILVFSIMGVIRGYFQGHNNMLPTAISQIVEQVVNAAVSILAAMYMVKKYAGDPAVDAYGAAGGTWGTFLGACAAAVCLVVIYVIQRPLFAALWKQDMSDYVESNRNVMVAILATVLPVVISQTVYQLSGNIDVTVFHRILSERGFSASVRNQWWSVYSNKYVLLSNVPVAIASAMGTAIVPGLIAEYSRMNFEGIRQRVASAVKFNMLIAFPCAVGLSVLSGPILRLLFGDGSALSARMLSAGGICVVFFALSTVTNGILQGIDRMRIPVFHSAVALVLHVILLVVLLKFTHLDAMSLVLANVFFALVVCVLNWRSIGKYLDYRQEIDRTFVRPFLASLLMGAAVYGLHALLAHILRDSAATVLSIAAAVPIYGVGLLLLGCLTEEELRSMPKGTALLRLLRKLHIRL